jgi:GNAT superfamily N-acetyltransferase
MAANIRSATLDDLASILELIRELAAYEKLSAMCVATEELLAEHLFGAESSAKSIVADVEGQVVGYAIWFKTFSTFLGRPGMWLEDIYVRPAFRKRGLGKSMVVHLAAEAHRRGFGRFEWSVLDWNAPAIEFYKSLGAVSLDDWSTMRVSGTAIKKLAMTIT